MDNQKNFTRSIFILLILIVLTGFLGILKATASVSIPITFSIMMAFVFYPLLKKMNEIHIPWALGIFIILIVTFFIFSLLGNLFKSSLQAILNAYPKYETKFQTLYQYIVEKLDIPYDEDSSLMKNLMNSVNVRGILQEIAVTLSSNVINFTKVALMIVLFFMFLLAELKTISGKMTLAFPNESSRKKITTIITQIITDVTHYISIKFLVSLITGLLVCASTAAIHMDFPIVWGFAAFILNFIPSFGSIISWGMTTVFALMQFFPHWGYGLYIGVVVFAINFILGNVVEPRWEGSDLGLSPFIILVSLSIWGYIWGFVGMILAVPLMVSIKLICEHIPSLTPVAAILGNGKARDPKQSFFKKLKTKKIEQRKY